MYKVPENSPFAELIPAIKELSVTYSAKEVAHILNVSIPTVYRLAERHRIDTGETIVFCQKPLGRKPTKPKKPKPKPKEKLNILAVPWTREGMKCFYQ